MRAGKTATGNDNTVIGAGALSSNTANANTAIGFNALSSNFTGSHNTATGFKALQDNTTFGTQNTTDGSQALQSNTFGFANTAVGFQALFSNRTGDNNPSVGSFALKNTTGNFNTAIGDLAGFNLTTGGFNIDIGNGGAAGESGTIRIGGGLQTRTFIAGIRGMTTGQSPAIPVLVDSFGQLGTTSSSRRFKEKIKSMERASEAILALRPVTFEYKSDKTDTPQFGLIAEEVAEVNPDLVVRDENGDIYTVRYDAVNVMLLNEFLKEHKKVEEQQATIAELKDEVQTVMAQRKEQAAQIQKASNQIKLTKPALKMVDNNE